MAEAARGQSLPGPGMSIEERRNTLFRETPLETAERVALGIAWLSMPARWPELPPLVRLLARHLVAGSADLPNPEATVGKSRMAGTVNDLTVPTLIEAYKRGLHSAGHFGTLRWESPPERCVLFFDEYHFSKRLRRVMRQGRYTVTFDRDFEGVIKACAERRTGKWHVTWITPRIMRAYAALFDAGYVHSFEVWNENGELVGGGYGVALGRIFFTESQFSREDNTSKLGFSVLNWHLARWGYILNDGKDATPTILDMGFRVIPRAEFLRHLAHGTPGGGKTGRWQVEAGPDVVAEWKPGEKSPALAPDDAPPAAPANNFAKAS
jgi:leucyl/phenylalanyl-tRNA--protein transferase